jgi:hypothetical protein
LYFLLKSTKVISKNTSYAKSFYDNINITDFDNKNVIYLGATGICDNEYLIKYGITSQIFEREKQHKCLIGDHFKIIYVAETDNKEIIESKFETILKSKQIHQKLAINNKTQTELFLTNDNFTIEVAIDTINQLITGNPLKAIEDKNTKIKELEYQMDNEKGLLIEKERTKQEELKLKQIEIQEKERTKQLELKIRILELSQIPKQILKPVKNIIKFTDQIKEKQDIYKQFLDNNTEKFENDNLHTSGIYIAFKHWFL